MRYEYLALVAIGFWLLILSFFVYQIFAFFKRLSHGVEGKNVLEILKKILEGQSESRTRIQGLENQIARIDNESLANFKKFRLIRFNPFGEVGGDHSFCLVLLDGEDNGVVITGLHTRERTRVYVKDINRGKSRYELSREEEKALNSVIRK